MICNAPSSALVNRISGTSFVFGILLLIFHENYYLEGATRPKKRRFGRILIASIIFSIKLQYVAKKKLFWLPIIYSISAIY